MKTATYTKTVPISQVKKDIHFLSIGNHIQVKFVHQIHSERVKKKLLKTSVHFI